VLSGFFTVNGWKTITYHGSNIGRHIYRTYPHRFCKVEKSIKTSRLFSSVQNDAAIEKKIEFMISSNSIVLFMKGDRLFPQW
jgi:formylmethanofuran dehydrogenase subunit B